MSNEEPNAVYEILEQSASGLRLRVEFRRRVNAALVAANVPFVRAVAVHNDTGRELAGVELTLGLSVGNGDFRMAVCREEGRLAAGGVVHFDGTANFAELAPLIAACPESAVAMLTVDACPLFAPGSDSGDGQWPTLSAAVEIGAADGFFNLDGLWQAVAAFVRPESPAVKNVLEAAAKTLARKTGSAALDGYQRGYGRAKQIAGAIYQALRDANLVWEDAAAALDAEVVAVRSHEQVLEERCGNCLDLSVLYAACCEAAGLRSLVVLAARHAFPAFVAVSDLDYSLALGSEQGFELLGEAVLADAEVIAHLIEAKIVMPVELDRAAPGKAGVSFQSAIKKGVDYARGHARELRAAVSIPHCRSEHAPASALLPHEMHVFRPEDMPESEPFPAMAPPVASVETPGVELRHAPRAVGVVSTGHPELLPARIAQWLRALFDFVPGNPLLDLPTDGLTLELALGGGGLDEIVDTLRKGKRLQCLSAGDSALEALVNGASGEFDAAGVASGHYVHSRLEHTRHVARLRALRRTAATREEDSGSACLYLVCGALAHEWPDGGAARAPLFLLPVKLGATGVDFALGGDGAVVVNPCLKEWLATRGQTLDALDAAAPQGAMRSLDAALTQVREAVEAAGLPYRVEAGATLAILDLAAFRMWRDLSHNWRAFMANPLARHLVEQPGTPFVVVEPDTAIDAEKLLPPLAADGAQQAALAAAAMGKSFVLEGAPGTGKSQTIANLVALALDAGRRVLFVSGKEAALRTVGARLKAAGLGDFALEVHGAGPTMIDLRKQLKRSLRATASDNEAAWKAALARHGDALSALRDYPARVHAANAAGFSLWTAFEALANLGDGPSWNLDPRFVGKVDAAAMASALAQAVYVLRQIGAGEHDPWLVVGFEDVGALTFTTLTRALEELDGARRRVIDLGRGWPDAFKELKPGRYLSAVNECIAANKEGLLPSKAHFRDIDRQSWRDAVAALRRKLTAFLDANRETLDTLGAALIDSPQLNDWMIQATRLGHARLFAEHRRRPVREAVAELLASPLDLSGDGLLDTLRRAERIRGEASDLRAEAVAIAGLILPANWAVHRPQALMEFDAAVHLSQRAVWLERHAPAAWLKAQEPKANAEIEALKAMETAWARWLEIVGANERSIAQWLGSRHWLEAWDDDTRRWADDLAGTGLVQLQRHAWLRRELRALDEAGAADFVDRLVRKTFPLEQAGAVLQRGLATASLRERLVSTGLTAFDDAAQADTLAAFVDSARELRRLSVAGAPGRLAARRAFKADDAEGDVPTLMSRLERRRGGPDLRELFAQHADALLALTPAWLMSPGAVAEYLAADGPAFDLVIFDESSRLRVAEAIGALGRAAATVIVGDSRQLPPEAPGRAEEGEDEESILAAALAAGLPRLRLNWHYSSRDEGLIAFANERYYEGALATLPPARPAGDGVLLRRVLGARPRADGGNEAEARAVVDELIARLRDPARRDESLGVLCFATAQRDLILDLLEESSDAALQEALASADGERLFVKLVDDAQGDVRDVVLLSPGLAAEDGGAPPTEFAPLDGKLGERRMNLAVTRARRQMVVFASFDAARVEPERVASDALRDLMDFVAFAGREADDAGSDGELAEGRGLVASIATALAVRGYVVRTRVGRSTFRVDLAVKKPGDALWRLAIVVDGPQWQARATVMDRDGAPELLHEMAGWPLVGRVWLPGWLRNREGVIARLVDLLENGPPPVLNEASDSIPLAATDALEDENVPV
ncbi:MAG: DUF4011 domain-containing protein [Azoarcus sp.]|nr:DUF4011 domain-containing protein [Azoarcus sp.]